jgi:hypothetical protein
LPSPPALVLVKTQYGVAEAVAAIATPSEMAMVSSCVGTCTTIDLVMDV